MSDQDVVDNEPRDWNCPELDIGRPKVPALIPPPNCASLIANPIEEGIISTDKFLSFTHSRHSKILARHAAGIKMIRSKHDDRCVIINCSSDVLSAEGITQFARGTLFLDDDQKRVCVYFGSSSYCPVSHRPTSKVIIRSKSVRFVKIITSHEIDLIFGKDRVRLISQGELRYVEQEGGTFLVYRLNGSEPGLKTGNNEVHHIQEVVLNQIPSEVRSVPVECE